MHMREAAGKSAVFFGDSGSYSIITHCARPSKRILIDMHLTAQPNCHLQLSFTFTDEKDDPPFYSVYNHKIYSSE